MIARWREGAARYGLRKSEIERMASAFEHDDFRAALARALRSAARPLHDREARRAALLR